MSTQIFLDVFSLRFICHTVCFVLSFRSRSLSKPTRTIQRTSSQKKAQRSSNTVKLPRRVQRTLFIKPSTNSYTESVTVRIDLTVWTPPYNYFLTSPIQQRLIRFSKLTILTESFRNIPDLVPSLLYFQKSVTVCQN